MNSAHASGGSDACSNWQHCLAHQLANRSHGDAVALAGILLSFWQQLKDAECQGETICVLFAKSCHAMHPMSLILCHCRVTQHECPGYLGLMFQFVLLQSILHLRHSNERNWMLTMGC